jgi:hypothetical protein
LQIRQFLAIQPVEQIAAMLEVGGEEVERRE